jgi:hypothetical protein
MSRVNGPLQTNLAMLIAKLVLGVIGLLVTRLAHRMKMQHSLVFVPEPELSISLLDTMDFLALQPLNQNGALHNAVPLI